MKILVADDESRIRENFIKRLRQLSLPMDYCFQATNGVEAFEIIQKEEIDIALIDINMPLLNGLELLEKIHRENKNIQTVIISGYDNFSYAQEAIKYGVKAYLLKPVNRQEFKDVMLTLSKNIQSTSNSNFEEKIKSEMTKNLGNPDFSLSHLAEQMSLSNGHLSKLILNETNQSFVELLTSIRMEKAKKLFKELPLGTKVYEVAELTGFNNQYYFSSVFKRETGLSPKEYTKKLHGIK